jgi:hypothetical protein
MGDNTLAELPCVSPVSRLFVSSSEDGNRGLAALFLGVSSSEDGSCWMEARFVGVPSSEDEIVVLQARLRWFSNVWVLSIGSGSPSDSTDPSPEDCGGS